MPRIAMLLVGLTLAAPQNCRGADGGPPREEDGWLYVARYCPQAGEGIFVATFVGQAGRIGNLQPTGGLQSPAALAIHPNGRFLYATTTWSQPTGESTGGVAAMEVNAAPGILLEI